MQVVDIRRKSYDIENGVGREDCRLAERAPAAQEARKSFVKVHQIGERPEQIREYKVGRPEISFVDALVESALLDSKSDARRQIEQGAIKVNDVVMTDRKGVLSVDVPGGVVLQKGKLLFVRLVV